MSSSILGCGCPRSLLPAIELDPQTVVLGADRLDRVADGLVAEEWICSDMASLFSQLTGALDRA